MKIRSNKIQLILEIVHTFLHGLDSNNNGWIESEELAEGIMRVLRRAKLPWYVRLVVQKPVVTLAIERIAALVPSPKAVEILQNTDSVKKTAAQERQKPAEVVEKSAETAEKSSRTTEKLVEIVKKSAEAVEKSAEVVEKVTEATTKTTNPLQSLDSETFLREALKANLEHLGRLLNNG